MLPIAKFAHSQINNLSACLTFLFFFDYVMAQQFFYFVHLIRLVDIIAEVHGSHRRDSRQVGNNKSGVEPRVEIGAQHLIDTVVRKREELP